MVDSIKYFYLFGCFGTYERDYKMSECFYEVFTFMDIGFSHRLYL